MSQQRKGLLGKLCPLPKGLQKDVMCLWRSVIQMLRYGLLSCRRAVASTLAVAVVLVLPKEKPWLVKISLFNLLSIISSYIPQDENPFKERQ